MNTILNTLKQLTNTLVPEKPIEKDVKDQLKQIVLQLKKNDVIDKRIINTLIYLLGKTRLNKKDKEDIVLNFDIIIEQLDIGNKIVNKTDIIETDKYLDNQIGLYSKYTKEKPMLGIRWIENRRRWRLQYNKTDIYDINLETLTKKMKKTLQLEYSKQNKTEIICTLNKSYNNKLVSYIYNNMELFDIRHIIKLLTKKNDSYKLSLYKNKIKYYLFHKNEFGGYIIRELITKETVEQIIHSTRKVQMAEFIKLVGMEIKTYYTTKEQYTLDSIMDVYKDEEMIDQKPVDQYRIDLYFPKYRIAIECDENGHDKRDKIYEIGRENYIKKKLNCKFIRFNPDANDFNINNVINEIFKEIIKYYSKINDKEFEAVEENKIDDTDNLDKFSIPTNTTDIYKDIIIHYTNCVDRDKEKDIFIHYMNCIDRDKERELQLKLKNMELILKDKEIRLKELELGTSNQF